MLGLVSVIINDSTQVLWLRRPTHAEVLQLLSSHWCLRLSTSAVPPSFNPLDSVLEHESGPCVVEVEVDSENDQEQADCDPNRQVTADEEEASIECREGCHVRIKLKAVNLRTLVRLHLLQKLNVHNH